MSVSLLCYREAEVLRHVGSAACYSQRLNMFVNTPASWSAHLLRTCPGTLSKELVYDIGQSGVIIRQCVGGVAVRQCLDAIPRSVGVVGVEVLLNVQKQQITNL